MPSAPWTIYLVNPIGGRYRIATLAPNTFPALWSPDRRRAVMHSYVGARDTLREYDLRTGRQLASFVLGNRSLLSYAGPGAHSLLVSSPAVGDGTTSLELVSTAGILQRTLPSTISAFGPFSTVLYRPDGSAFLAAGRHGFVVVGDDGRLIRQVGFPAGAQQCRVNHWWTAEIAIGTCSYLTPGNGSGVQNLAEIPVEGGAVRAITHVSSPHYGFTDAWQFSSGILASVAGSCGSGELATIDTAGNSRPYPYRLPVGVTGQARLLGVHADRAILITGSCGTRGRSVVSLDLRTGVTSALLGPGLNGGSVW